MSEGPYVVLIGDAVASREVDDRPGFQRELLRMIEEVNGVLGRGHFAAPLTLTAGDECQAVLRQPRDVVVVVQELTDRGFGAGRFPHLIFGIGRGEVATGPLPSPPAQAPNPALLDGPCFHAARDALREAKSNRLWARFRGFGTDLDAALNALFELMAAVRSDWAPKQGIYSYQVRGHARQKDLARQLNVGPSVISESLKGAHHGAILAGERAARALLDRVDDWAGGKDEE